MRSLISLCLIDGNPPFGQDKACSTENWVPQSQLMGVRDGSHPYRKHRASRKALLCRVNPNSATGRAVSQLEAPFSWASSIERCSELPSVTGRQIPVVVTASCYGFLLWPPFVLLGLQRDILGSFLRLGASERSNELFRGHGLLTPIPPSLTGRAKRSRSASLGGGRPVRIGMSFVRRVSSIGFRRLPMFGVVRDI